MARGYGSGSKRETRKGVWELRAGGKSRTFKGTGKDAEIALAKLVAEVSIRPATVSTTFGELIDEWLRVARIQRSTRATYMAALAHLPAKIRGLRLSALSLRTFDRLYADLTAAGVSAYQVRKLHTVLSSALTEGLRWQWIASHPARGARLPRLADRKVIPPSSSALSTLLATAAAEDDLQTLVWLVLALGTGLRRGELLALRWSRVDLETGTITVAASLEEDRAVTSTKSNRIRPVTLDEGTLALLRHWRTAQIERAIAVPGLTLAADPWVLSNDADSGTPWRPDGATQRFRRLCKRAGVTGVRLHDLRHGHVSMLLAAKIPVTNISPRVGHKSTKMTLDVYGHLMDDADRDSAAAIGGALRALLPVAH